MGEAGILLEKQGRHAIGWGSLEGAGVPWVCKSALGEARLHLGRQGSFGGARVPREKQGYFWRGRGATGEAGVAWKR